MEKLIAGIHRFRKQYWSENKELFEAWFFEIGTGTVFSYSPEREQFEPIRYEVE